MILKKPTGRKYITRMDFVSAKGEWVRILDSRDGKGKVSKFFADSKYQSKQETLRAATKFRDNYFKRLTKAEKIINRATRKDCIFSDGIYIEWKNRLNGYAYPYICVSWNNDCKQYKKMFSVEKHGYDKALSLAKKTRAEKTKNKKRMYA